MTQKNRLIIAALSALVFLVALMALFTGSSGMTLPEGLAALMQRGTRANNRILWSIRMPRRSRKR